MRRFSLLVALGAIAAAVMAPGSTSTAEPQRRTISFDVANPNEDGKIRTLAGYRYDPPCKASTVVLLQHGLSYTGESWDFPGYSVARPLAEAGYAVVAIDRLGYGKSKLEDGNRVSQEALADMTRQMVAQLRQEFDHVVLGGHSAGGGITMLTQGLFGSGDAILVLAWHHWPSEALVRQFMTEEEPRALRGDYMYWLGSPENRATWHFSTAADPAVVTADAQAAVLTPSGEIHSIGKQPSRYVTANIRVPVFLQLGELDPEFEPKYVDAERQLLSNSPSVTVDVVPAAAHTFMLHPTGREGTARLVNWLRGRPEAPACS